MVGVPADPGLQAARGGPQAVSARCLVFPIALLVLTGQAARTAGFVDTFAFMPATLHRPRPPCQGCNARRRYCRFWAKPSGGRPAGELAVGTSGCLGTGMSSGDG